MSVGNIGVKGTLKMARHKEQTDAQGALTTSIKIPGTPGTNEKEGRLLLGGDAWFANHHADDICLELWIEDIDGLIPEESRAAFPNYPKIASYTDMEADVNCRGWYFGPDNKIRVEAIAGVRTVKSGFYLKIKVLKGDATQDTLRLNLIWGDPNDK